METSAIQVNSLSKAYLVKGTAQESSYQTLREKLSRFPFLMKKSSGSQDFFWALKDISFSVNYGEVLGVIGANGAGKSTILKILSRITSPTKGSVELWGKVSSLLEVGTGFHPELTGLENIFLSGTILGMRRTEIKKVLDEVISFAALEDFIHTPVKRYSSGMKVRLGFAVAAYLNSEILIIDEVLAVGDRAFQKKCLGRIGEVAQSGRAVIFVSHNLTAVRRLCTKAILLEQGQILSEGNPHSVIGDYLGYQQKQEMFYDGQPISHLKAWQDQKSIKIEAKYLVDEEVYFPSLGFVIYDEFGQPITGGNPMLLAEERKKYYPKKGKITITIYTPKLLDGQYRISIWFSLDGHRNIQVEPNALTIEVQGMSNIPADRRLAIGPVEVECNYSYQELN